jgi:hypothetical protein
MVNNIGFRQIYKKLPTQAKYRTTKRNEIIKQCGILQHTFYAWLQGFSPIPTHHKATIAQILNVNVSDLD